MAGWRSYVCTMHTSELVQRLATRLREGSPKPASYLISEELWLAVVEGSLDVGQRLPTTRELAIALGLDPRSIERAYDELERRGVTVTRQGAGTFVSLAPASEEARERHQQFAELCADAVQRASALGFSVDDLVDALAEYRIAERDTRS
jgi:GntR family transcriptional regulator